MKEISILKIKTRPAIRMENKDCVHQATDGKLECTIKQFLVEKQ